MSVDTHGLEVLRRSAEEITPGNAQELLLRTSTEPNYSFVSTDNSSSAILNNGQTYTGSWENTTGFSTVAFSVKTDQSGSLYADFSVDGVNVDSTLTYTVEASTNEVHRLTITKQYFRLRFTNSSGSTTDLIIKCASFAVFIEGEKYLHGPRFSYFNQLTTVGAANYQAFFTIMNARTYSGRANQSVINIISVSGALKHTSPCVFYLIKGGNLGGNPNFSSYATNLTSLYDSAATTVAVSTNDQILWSGHLGDTGELDNHFNGGGAEEITLQPGEWITLAAKAVTGTPSYVTGYINTREDQ